VNQKQSEEKYKLLLTRFMTASFVVGFFFGIVFTALVVKTL
tara:strand:+ start:5588 stop:5710 length:123 start_codon:yes stop_codon:yes gene_type:complete